MAVKGEYLPEEMIFSCIYGGGVYQPTGQVVQDPLGGDNGHGLFSPLLRSVITGEEYFVKLVECTPLLRESYRERVLRSPARRHILWPADMVDLEERDIGCRLFVAQEYTDTPVEPEGRGGNVGLLFPYGGYPPMVSGERKLSQIQGFSWKNPEIRKMACQLLVGLEDVNRCGYVYGDMHLSRIFFLEDDSVYFNFSGLVLAFSDLFSKNVESLCAVEGAEYPLEFADPVVARGLRKTLDFQSQNYSLAALLFYLLLGQYPYDGRLLTGYVDDSPQHHYIKFRDYLKMPVFIFDPEDRQNALGAFAEEETVIRLWEELHPVLRQAFISTLRKENAERALVRDNPTPSMWLAYFRAAGWEEAMEV